MLKSTKTPDAGPAYRAAMMVAMQSLYGKDAAASDVLQAIKSANDTVQAMADTAYKMVQIVDERTRGQVPDEQLVPLASEILGEVAEIMKAGGMVVTGRMIAEATKNMLLRYVREAGLNPAQLQAAMGSVDTSQLGQALDKIGA